MFELSSTDQTSPLSDHRRVVVDLKFKRIGEQVMMRDLVQKFPTFEFGLN